MNIADLLKLLIVIDDGSKPEEILDSAYEFMAMHNEDFTLSESIMNVVNRRLGDN